MLEKSIRRNLLDPRCHATRLYRELGKVFCSFKSCLRAENGKEARNKPTQSKAMPRSETAASRMTKLRRNRMHAFKRASSWDQVGAGVEGRIKHGLEVRILRVLVRYAG